LVLRYESVADREIAGLIASSLAYGRVVQILRSASTVLDRMQSPLRYLTDSSRRSITREHLGFKHRFTTDRELSALLIGIKNIVESYGSLEACFKAGCSDGEPDICASLCKFVDELRSGSGSECGSLLPDPRKGSACKRLNLYLKWMVRKDEVDPGGWDCVDASDLIVPLDTHMHRIGGLLGMIKTKQANMKAAKELTGGFRKFAPDDPTKYDFALTRLGMEYGMRISDYIESITRSGVGDCV
jgi:uncharacterized protein (TIGR02757 family)